MVGALQRRVGFHIDGQSVAFFDIEKVRALLVENIDRAFHRHLGVDGSRTALHGFRFDAAQHMQRHRFHRAHNARARAMRADHGRAFQHARAHALARHFHQAEVADASHLNAGAVGFQRVLELAFHRAVVAVFVHVDEVDDDKTRKVAQARLTRHFFGGFKVRAKRRLLDIAFFRRPARVHVDGDQRFRRVDDDIAARLQRNGRVEHGVELLFHLELLEQRLAILVGLHVLCVARHEHTHEALGFLVAFVAFDEDGVDVLVVEVADRALDQAAFFIDEGRGDGAHRQLAHAFPHAQQIFVVALDFRLGALGACRADNQAHAFRHIQRFRNGLELLAVGSNRDLARNAAATRRVGHQYAIATGQRQECCQSRAFVAALFLDHLHQHDLAALHDFLNLVVAEVDALLARFGLFAHFFMRVASARRLHRMVGLDAVFVVLVLILALGRGFGVFFVRSRFDGLCRLVILCSVSLGFRLDLRFVGVGLVCFFAFVHGFGRDGGDRIGGGCGLRRHLFFVAIILAVALGFGVLGVFFFLRLARLGGLMLQQRLAVCHRDLIVVGVNFAEREKTVTVAAIFDEGRLQRGLYARDTRQIDVAAKLFAGL